MPTPQPWVADGVDFVARSLDACNAAKDVSDFIEEWHYLARGHKLDQQLSIDELYNKRDAWLAEVRAGNGAGVASPTWRIYSTDLPMTHAEWKAGQEKLAALDGKMAGLIRKYEGSAPGHAPDVKAVVDARQALRKKLREYESAGGSVYLTAYYCEIAASDALEAANETSDNLAAIDEPATAPPELGGENLPGAGAQENAPAVPTTPGPTPAANISLDVFGRISGIKPDQFAGFAWYARRERLGPRPVVQWRDAYEKLLARAV